MAEASKAIREFFDEYAKATGSLDLAFLGTAYGDTFMFAGPGGVQAVKRDDFLKVVPKRGATYILRRQENSLQIVFQLDHQDLTKRLDELGLLPASG